MPAATVMNASVNNTHSPSHRTARSQSAIWVGMGLPAPNSEPLLIPKAMSYIINCRFPTHSFGESTPPLPPPPKKSKGGKGKKKKNQWGGEQKLGLVSAGEINPVSVQWGAGAFPAPAPIRSVREPALHFILSRNPKGGPKNPSRFFSHLVTPKTSSIVKEDNPDPEVGSEARANAGILS